MDIDQYGNYLDRDLVVVETGEGGIFSIGVSIFVNKEGKGKRKGVEAEGTIEKIVPLVDIKRREKKGVQ